PTALPPLSLHDALPIWRVRHPRQRLLQRTLDRRRPGFARLAQPLPAVEIAAVVFNAYRKTHGGKFRALVQPAVRPVRPAGAQLRSEEHTSELQSRENLV